MQEQRVVLNVGGKRFETAVSTLYNIPNTRLSSLIDKDETIPEEKVFFFDRNPEYFGPILDFYRNGELHFPHSFCGLSIKKELHYWNIDEHCISSCCWIAFKRFEEDNDKMVKLDRALHDPETWSQRPLLQKRVRPAENAQSLPELRSFGEKKKTIKEIIWIFLDRPQTSITATVWAFFVYSLILLSIIIVIMETHPWFRVSNLEQIHSSDAIPNNNTNPKVIMYTDTTLHPALEIIDGICICVFTVELVLRFITCPSKLSFLLNVYNIIDVLCVLPRLLVYIIENVEPNIFAANSGDGFVIVMIYRSLSSVLRVFRLFKLARHYVALKIMMLAVRSSLRELSLLLILITMGTLVFSTLVYFAEFHVEDNFPSIPIGFWWSTITMTTVGYGDVAPKAPLGYIVGITCAISGMLITGLPIPIIANNLNHYYRYARMSAKIHNKLKSEKKIWTGPNESNKEPGCCNNCRCRDKQCNEK